MRVCSLLAAEVHVAEAYPRIPRSDAIRSIRRLCHGSETRNALDIACALMYWAVAVRLSNVLRPMGRPTAADEGTPWAMRYARPASPSVVGSPGCLPPRAMTVGALPCRYNRTACS